MAERYAKLPTEIIRTATTFDLFICDTAMEYRAAQQARMQEEAASQSGQRTAKITPKLSVEEMQAMMAKVKGRSNESKV